MTEPLPATEPDRMLADTTTSTSSSARIIGPGTPDPLGATWSPDGVNVSVYAKRATAVDLLLFDDARGPIPEPRPRACRPARTAPAPTGMRSSAASRRASCTGIASPGRRAPERGLRFDPTKVLLDPYGTGVAIPDGYRPPRTAARPATAVRDEERRHRPGRLRLGGRPAARPIVPRHDHLRGPRRGLHGGTRAPASPTTRRGTYRGLHRARSRTCVDLGVTAVELLPVFAVRPVRRASRADQLLGLPAGLVLRAAPGLRSTNPAGQGRSTSSATSSRRSTAPASR